MTNKSSHGWGYCIRPLWVGAAIGIIAGAIVETDFLRRYPSLPEDFQFSDINWVSYPIVMVEWGLVLGLLASVDRIARSWKRKKSTEPS